MEQQIPLVKSVNSYKLNVRQVAQQGVFLCPGTVKKSFEANLAALFDPPEKRCNVIKFVIKEDPTELRKFRNKGLNRLHSMNISNATLFPGLEGFAKSLETRAKTDKKFKSSNQIMAGRFTS